MMRSLWSGVSGLRVHQVGMDVEGNNIANVNTYGFKYSRVNYSTMFAQTMAIATQPTDTTGGKNAKQVGLGVMAAATQRIHSQGSISGTDSNYDVAIEGNGFFLVSNDGGKTRYLTRDGAFNQDAAGNFVNSNGYVVQGWVRDPVTGRIDTALSPGNLSWDPAMNLPANPSSSIFLNAQLNSGNKITDTTSRYIYQLDSVHGRRVGTGTSINENQNTVTEFYTTSKNALDVTEKGVDFASVFNASTYEGLNLREGQSFWMSYADSVFTTNTGTTQNELNTQARPPAGGQAVTGYFWGNGTTGVTLDIRLNGIDIRAENLQGLDQVISAINKHTKRDDGKGTGVIASAGTNNTLVLTNNNSNAYIGDGGMDDSMKNIHLRVNAGNQAGEISSIQPGQTTVTLGTAGQDSAWTRYQRADIAGAVPQQPPQGTLFGPNEIRVVTAHRYEYRSRTVDIDEMYDPVNGGYDFVDPLNHGFQAPLTDEQQRRVNGSMTFANAVLGGFNVQAARQFHTTEDLRELMQRDARYGVDYAGKGSHRWFEFTAIQNGTHTNLNIGATVTVNETGNFVVSNPTEQPTARLAAVNLGQGTYTGPYTQQIIGAGNTYDLTGTNATKPKIMTFQASGYKSEAAQVSTNEALVNMFRSITGELQAGTGSQMSSRLLLSSFSTSLEMYDSLGSKHLLRVEWSKHETTKDGGNRWQMILRLDEPATFNGTDIGRNNIIVGSVSFGNDGSLSSFTPTSITFSGNNGSAPNQRVELNLGASSGFNGLVSNEQTSALSQQQTDGYAPGVLKQGMQNMSIDQNGVIVGTFTNGITMAMGQIAMGNVVNEAGLQDMGNNLWAVSNNSGTLTIGAPNVGGRGAFKSGALELSNADLSLSLTNLIVIQRGYQANSKTITTSDTMLNTLLQLKQ